MQKIVILGAGFAGLAATLVLQKKNLSNSQITLVDQQAFHLFTPSLYEVATQEEPQKNIAFPLREILSDKIAFLNAKVSALDFKKQLIFLADKSSISYDYLLLGLGSEADFYAIAGLQEFALPLKTIADAVRIKDRIKKVYRQNLSLGKPSKIIIAGGGFSGTELAAELITYRAKLSRQYQQPEDLLEIAIIQGSDRLLKELDSKVSVAAQRRIASNKIKFYFGSHIRSVSQDQVITADNQVYAYDCLIWTGGVKANAILGRSGLLVNKKGQVSVQENLLVQGFKHVFAAGDNVEFRDPLTKTLAPTVAEVAEEQGKIAGENIYRSIQGENLLRYKYQHLGYIVPLKGHFAICSFGNLVIGGWLGWLLQQIVFLRYLLAIMPLSKALKKWNKFEQELKQ